MGMGNHWKYNLYTGSALRKCIREEDTKGILETLKKCYKEIHKVMPDWYDEDDLENDIEDIDNELDSYINMEEYDDLTEEDIEDNVNYLLDKFYGFCDSCNIWVGL